ncbi:MAG TPA: ATP-binding cassette domain-containing protein [Candidatus Polarisedimenticolaceae bacterium]|nr:ATP-binding cassette domain-containing protein [Candidatus Polarisedimenticolaceae bacterium]
MSLLRLDNISLSYGYLPLLSHVQFQIEAGERVCLLGRNGTGKTTLFRIVTGEVVPEAGEIWTEEGLRVAHLEQEVPPDKEQTVFEVVASGLGELGRLLFEYHHASHKALTAERPSLDELAKLDAGIESLGGWNLNQKVETVLTRLGLPPDKPMGACSGGVRRQVMLARALVGEPDLLLLDEPTNHLDISTIIWLEKFLLGFRGALMFITHDRSLLRHLATRIVELDRGMLNSYPGDFDAYLRKKDELLAIEERAAVKFDKKLAEEEAWIRRGVKARRTRNEGRVQTLQEMRRERSQRWDAQGKASFGIDAGVLSGKLVVDMRLVSFGYGDNLVVRDFSTRILRGDRVGIIGPNGSGKSTLLKLILGEIKPTRGEVVLGTRLQLAYFDQHRRILDPEKTVRENLSDSDYVSVQGRSRHVIGYLKEFLFPAQRIDSPVKALSGGERNRLLLAKIFTQPANMMVLDEPTNDLDVDTLELLEDLLADYRGTLLLVSHDRMFLDNIVTSTLVYEGAERFVEYAGGYTDWVRFKELSRPDHAKTPNRNRVAAIAGSTDRSVKTNGKLSYKEKRELEGLPARIELLETEQSELQRRMGQADFYRQPSATITFALERLEALGNELEECYARWQSLESQLSARGN